MSQRPSTESSGGAGGLNPLMASGPDRTPSPAPSTASKARGEDYVNFERSTDGFSSDAVSRVTATKLAVDVAIERNGRRIESEQKINQGVIPNEAKEREIRKYRRLESRHLRVKLRLGVDDKEVKIPELDALMYDRYGFQVTAMACDIHQGILTLPSDAFSLQRVTEVLMEKDAVSSPRSEAAVRLIATLIDRGLQIPDQYWDVKNGQLRSKNQGYFRFLPLKLTSLASDAVLEGYMVNPTTSRYLRPWKLLFESSIGIAQCVRESWGPSLEDVVCKACDNGYRIHLFLVRNKQVLPPLTSPPSLFTRRERQEGFTPSHFDFHAYQHIVEALVMQPRLRAAVLRGGILGRICSPYISLEDLAEGPSPDAIRYGLRWKAEGRNDVFVEDYISDDEVHLLCGYFHVDSSRSGGRRRQFKLFSFFPTPDIWEKSGIHTVVWSNSAEQKFRSLIEKLNPQSDEHSTSPIPVPFKTNTQWKSHLRLHLKQTKKFLGYVEAASTAFISSL